MTEPFLGEIRSVGFNWAPTGWASCDGQLVSISQNSALFSLLGTTYGGNGVTTFALPDLRGRAGVHQGQGPGLSGYNQGEQRGEEYVVLTAGELPSHSHTVLGSGSETTDRPAGMAPAQGGSYGPASGASMASTQPAGSNLPHNNLPPLLVLNYVIALQGIYPSRA
jgi:microcystin-dependent protein